MTIRDELLAIQKKHPQNMLRVEAVFKWAKANPKSALHKKIEWDKDKAAREYQYWQIRRLIQLNIVSEDGEPEVVSLTIDRARSGGGYRAIDDVIDNEQLSVVMLKDALQELDRVRIKYARVKELTSVWDAVEQVRKRKPRGGSKDTRPQA